MMQVQNHAEICPVCKGSGKYKEYMDYVTTTQAYCEKTCHGCGGKGWVIVPEVTETRWSNTGYSSNFNIDEIDNHIPHID